MRLYLLPVIIILLILNVFHVYSQDSLSVYLEIAARNNPTVLQKYYEYQAALQKVPQAGSMPDPELNVGVFLSPMELVSGNQVADIRLMQMFPWFGVLLNAKDEMSLMAKAKFESFRDAKLQVYYDVQRSWYELCKVKEEIRISEKNLVILHSLEQLMLVKFRTGSLSGSASTGASINNASVYSKNASPGSNGMQVMGSNQSTGSVNNETQASSSMQAGLMGSSGGGSALSDLYRLQIERADLENNIEYLKTLKSSITARFNAFLNRPAQTPVILSDIVIQENIDMKILSLNDSMFSDNPMLGMLQYENKSLEARRKMVTRMGYPMFGVGLNYTLINKSEMSTSAMNGKDMIMPMVTITLPIYRKKYRSMQSETDYMKQANEMNYKATENSLRTDYFEALQSFYDAERRIILYKKQSGLTKQSSDIIISSYSASGSGLTDILRIRQQLLDYQIKLVEAIIDYNTSIALIKRLTAFIEIK